LLHEYGNDDGDRKDYLDERQYAVDGHYNDSTMTIK
jgi:hypothetical protein